MILLVIVVEELKVTRAPPELDEFPESTQLMRVTSGDSALYTPEAKDADLLPEKTQLVITGDD